MKTLVLNKKSQAAMEFLMSYGWALLVVLLVIAALAYFGMLNPERFLPDKVNLGSGLTVLSSTLDERYLTLVVSNGLGKTLNNFQINATLCGSGGALSKPISFVEGKSERITIPCGKQLKNSKFKSELISNYTTFAYVDIVSHVSKGELRMTVNDGCKAEGLIAGYTFEKDAKDCSGNSHDGTLSGGPSLVKAKVGNGYQFDGIDDKITTNSISFGDKMTIIAWFSKRTLTDLAIFESLGTSQDKMFGLRASSGINGLTDLSSLWPTYYIGGTASSVSINTYYFGAFVQDGTRLSLYLNGALDNSLTIPGSIETFSAAGVIGQGAGNWYNVNFDGIIDELYIYDRALSSDEIKSLYLAGN
jgi:hypothetical protein